MTPTLFDRVVELVDAAGHAAVGTKHERAFLDIASRMREPLRVAIAGTTKAGKSTLLNALVGDVLAPTDAGECTRIVTWYREGVTYRATITPFDGTAESTSLRRASAGVEVDLRGWSASAIERIDVEWPAAALRTMTLIDTPGIGSISGIGARTLDFLAPDDDRPTAADAVIYLTRHLHSGDVRFLEAFHDGTASRTTPANAVAVLSRADELGGGRADSLQSARGIANRYRNEPAFRRYCGAVVPVAGLLAQAATSFTEAEFRALRRLADLDDDRAEALLASADRFVDPDAHGTGLVPAEREHLIGRLGVFGVRLGRDLVRHGRADTARRLADELRQRSGLDELRALVTTSFADRSGLLKARSAMAALDDALRRADLPNGPNLAAALERIESGAYELAELRVLTAVRTGAVPLSATEVEEVERVLGPGDAAVRMGATGATETELRQAAIDGVARWRRRIESPISSPIVVEASQVVTRAFEAMASTDPE